ncbi:WxcM-like domain-containing protein [Trichlorobacter lovleyi]|uniref:sugar 3,4-ketoisomerase n=1 Tax=Trichlorobacter lovleyi TaxID=313985 RepID=UPI00223EE219|nr:FdtA/QdtA family cupin domain-containing protein [Trichlorobacter lovleyi]QOX78010.1 WxcM-like domain-containing protein [Trichlorobacter lovleyi]
MKLELCRLIDLPKIADPRGNLTFVEGNNHIPFEIKRVFYLYDVPGGEMRAGHSNIESEQFIIAMSGSFDITLDDGFEKKTFHMNRAYYGLYIPTMIWREIDNFSSGAVCLALTSTTYSATDYIRDYNQFVNSVRK